MKTIFFMIITITLLLFILGNGYYSQYIYESMNTNNYTTYPVGNTNVGNTGADDDKTPTTTSAEFITAGSSPSPTGSLQKSFFLPILFFQNKYRDLYNLLLVSTKILSQIKYTLFRFLCIRLVA